MNPNIISTSLVLRISLAALRLVLLGFRSRKPVCLKGNPGSGLFWDLPKLVFHLCSLKGYLSAIRFALWFAVLWWTHTSINLFAVLQKILLNSFASRMPLKLSFIRCLNYSVHNTEQEGPSVHQLQIY